MDSSRLPTAFSILVEIANVYSICPTSQGSNCAFERFAHYRSFVESSAAAHPETADYLDPIFRQPSTGSACTATCPSVSSSRASSLAIL